MGSPLNKKPFTVWEPKPQAPSESWWIQKTREDFIVRRDKELPRIVCAKTLNPLAESKPTARQAAQNKKSKSSGLDAQLGRVMSRMRQKPPKGARAHA